MADILDAVPRTAVEFREALEKNFGDADTHMDVRVSTTQNIDALRLRVPHIVGYYTVLGWNTLQYARCIVRPADAKYASAKTTKNKGLGVVPNCSHGGLTCAGLCCRVGPRHHGAQAWTLSQHRIRSLDPGCALVIQPFPH